MNDRKDIERRPGESAVDAFLARADAVAPSPAQVAAAKGRLVFALDATMSRQPTWDLACRVQGGMFETAAGVGGLAVQLVYFRGFAECRASRWVADPKTLTGLMTRISCQGGQTQIERALRHIRNGAGEARIDAFVYVGDAVEEDFDALCALAGELGALGVKGFVFQEGRDPQAEVAFREIARLTGGAYERFDASAPGALASLLRAAAAYASGGARGLERLAAAEPGARRLMIAMRSAAERR